MVEKFDGSVDLESFLHNNVNESEFFDNKNYSNNNNIQNNNNVNIDSLNNTFFGQGSNLDYNNNNDNDGRAWMNGLEMPESANNYTPVNNNSSDINYNSNNGLSREGNASLNSLSPTTNQSFPTPNSSHNGNNDKVQAEEGPDKKKAQNRAAQRAFRERKQAKLVNLEKQLEASEANKEALQKEVEELRKLNQEIHAENRTLLQRNDKGNTSNDNQIEINGTSNNWDNQYISEQLLEKHIVHQKRDNFYKDLMAQVEETNKKHGQKVQNRTYEDDSGNTILTIPATWEYLQKNFGDEIDIIQVINMLKGNEVCHGAGGAYPKVLIDKAIQYIMESEQ